MKASIAHLALLATLATAQAVTWIIENEAGIQPNLWTFTKQEYAKLPGFYLDDETSTPGEKYAIALWDDGCPVAPHLYYLQSGLAPDRHNQLASDKPPYRAYNPPGTLNETGSERQYIWVLYNDTRESIDPKTLPKIEEASDIESFELSNGLQRVKLYTIQIDLGGEVSCDQAEPSKVAQSTSVRIVTSTVTTGPVIPPLPTDFWSKVESVAESMYSTQIPSTTLPSLSSNLSLTRSGSGYLPTGTAGISGSAPTLSSSASVSASANATFSASGNAPPSPSPTKNAAAGLTSGGIHGLVLAFAIALAGFVV